MTKTIKIEEPSIESTIASDDYVHLSPQDFYQFKYSDLIYDYGADGMPITLSIDETTWIFFANGNKIKLHWDKFANLSPGLIELFKGFLYHRFQNVSASYIHGSHLSFIRVIDKHVQLSKFPWEIDAVNDFLGLESIQKNSNLFYCLKAFYHWGITRSIFGFDKNIFNGISSFKIGSRNSYEKVFLRQSYLENEKIDKLINFIKTNPSVLLNGDFDPLELQIKVLLQLCFELAPRPSQIYLLNDNDFIFFDGSSEVYYSLDLPMSKKRRQTSKEKRVRKISESLGTRIKLLIDFKRTANYNHCQALFVNKKGERYGSYSLIRLLSDSFKKYCGFEFKEGTILLRHNLAQSLADQGASAEAIADILGHNSTLPSRAYIAATPRIAEIKTKALGKNNNYNNIIYMLNTGDVISRENVEKSTWVKGIVGFQYIGEVGACGLNHPCPKNPVYSCYSCKKFNPFSDGEHENVLKGLEENVQLYLDTGGQKKDLQHNRTIIQLEKTILAVKEVIHYLKLENEK